MIAVRLVMHCSIGTHRDPLSTEQQAELIAEVIAVVE
jgi:D-serine deaminase-like pyridoxal phosphate-dependent protein